MNNRAHSPKTLAFLADSDEEEEEQEDSDVDIINKHFTRFIKFKSKFNSKC